ncbi:hypothetical protein, partial [Roseateles sp. P5_E11]
MIDKPRSAAPSPSPAGTPTSRPVSGLSSRLGRWALWALGVVAGGIAAVCLLLALGLALAYP